MLANLITDYNNGEYPQWFDGKIGIVRIYNKSLTSAEVLNNYNKRLQKRATKGINKLRFRKISEFLWLLTS